jgi:hypothetical protein
VSQFRLRFDAAWDNNRPDRAEFFYPKCGCFAQPQNRSTPGALFDPNAPGPPRVEKSVNYQELRSYLEWAVQERVSGFVEVPVRFINPQVNDNASGLGDINFGFKYAFLYDPDTVVSGQVRAYAPSGDPFKGLGNDHWTIEPAVLMYQRLSECFYLEGELAAYIPIDSKTDFAGNVLRYGASLSYLLYNAPSFRIVPVAECVGWTVLDGKELTDQGVKSAGGDTIVNAKMGLRIGLGEVQQPGVLSKVDLYVGYGRALTGAVWYKDMLRVELRYRF